MGAILFETLTGERLLQPGASLDPARVASARGSRARRTRKRRCPSPSARILQKSLTADPAVRYAEIADMRKAVDALLFSGDFTPTTFNLAFFMHSLFRDDIDREAKALAEERAEHYLEFLADESHPPAASAAAPTPLAVAAAAAVAASASQAPAAPAAPAPSPAPAAPPAPPAKAAAPPARPAAPPLVPPPGPRAARARAAQAAHPPAVTAPPPAAVHDATVPVAVRDATSGFTFHKEEPSGGGKMPLFAGIGVLLLALGAGAYFLLARKAAAPPPAAVATPAPTTLSPEAVAAMAKVKELEEKLAAFEAEKTAAAAKAEEDAKKKVVAQAAARGQAVDPAALQKAQDEARRRAEAEQARRQQEERLRLEQEQKAAEAKLAEEQRIAELRRQGEKTEARVAAAAVVTTLPATQPGPDHDAAGGAARDAGAAGRRGRDRPGAAHDAAAAVPPDRATPGGRGARGAHDPRGREGHRDRRQGDDGRGGADGAERGGDGRGRRAPPPLSPGHQGRRADQGLGPHHRQLRPAALAQADAGKVKKNVLPSPGLLSAQICRREPRRCTSRCRGRGPRPRRSFSPTCQKRSKTASSMSSGIPTPVSRHEKRSSASGALAANMMLPPRAVNLIAFVIRLASTWSIRSWSNSRGAAARRATRLERDALRRRAAWNVSTASRDERRRIGRRRRHGELAGVDARDVDEVSDQPVHARRVALDALARPPPLGLRVVVARAARSFSESSVALMTIPPSRSRRSWLTMPRKSSRFARASSDRARSVSR